MIFLSDSSSFNMMLLHCFICNIPPLPRYKTLPSVQYGPYLVWVLAFSKLQIPESSSKSHSSFVFLCSCHTGARLDTIKIIYVNLHDHEDLRLAKHLINNSVASWTRSIPLDRFPSIRNFYRLACMEVEDCFVISKTP